MEPHRTCPSDTGNDDQLVRILRSLRFGRVDGLLVRDGIPQSEPPPRIRREFRFGAERRSTVGAPRELPLRLTLAELFADLRQVRGEAVVSIEVRHGLPFRLIVEEPARG